MKIKQEFIVVNERYGLVKVLLLDDGTYLISSPKHGQFEKISKKDFDKFSENYNNNYEIDDSEQCRLS